MGRPRSLRHRWAIALLATLAVAALAAPAAWADGELDPSFDGDGRLLSDPTIFNEQVTDIAIDAEGRIVVAIEAVGSGMSPPRAVVARYNADGSIDDGFGSEGTVFVEWGDGTNSEAIRGIALDGAGRIVVAGGLFTGSLEFAVARFLPGGTHDPSFDEDGIATLAVPGGSGGGADVAVDTQNRVLVAGTATIAAKDSFALARFGAEGEPDKSLDGDGLALTDFPGMTAAEGISLALDPLGRPVLAGGAFGEGEVFAVARYDGAGALDPSFDEDGRATVDFGPMLSERATDVAIDASGRVVLAGESLVIGGEYSQLARLLPNGAPDAGFGGDGKVVNDPPDPIQIQRLAVDPVGRIVTVGTAGIDAGQDALVSRHLDDGALDPAFGAGGSVLEDFSAPTAKGTAVAIDAAGRYVVAGIGYLPESRVVGLARLLATYPSVLLPPHTQQPPVFRCRGRTATLVGTPRRDRLKGTKRRDIVAALAGNDVVRGLGGNDLICAGAGRDLVRAGGGRDVVLGGAGNDRLFGQGGRDRLLGQRGRDLLAGGPGRDALRGGPGRDIQR